MQRIRFMRNIEPHLFPDPSLVFCHAGRPQYNHVGEIIDGIDMRAEVALLSRNILIHGEMENSCYGNDGCQFYSHDTYGGHVKVCLRSSVCVCVCL